MTGSLLMSAVPPSRMARLALAALVLVSGWHCAAADDESTPPARQPDGSARQGEAGVAYESDGSAGGSDAGAADAGGQQDGGWRQDAAEYNPWEGCGGRCPDGTPYCDGESGRCLACVVGDPDFNCPGSTPICKVDEDSPDDVGANTCVECLDQSDCERLCDPSTNQCVPCFVREDGVSVGCPASSDTPVCRPGPIGSRNLCVECVEDHDCESSTGGSKCDTEDSRCVECLEDIHCIDPTSPHCGEELACTGCDREKQCAHLPGTPLCESDTGACVECLENKDCPTPTSSRCDAEGFCAPCAENADCNHLEGQGVCDIDPEDGDNNRCVQCTEEDHSACSDYKDFVCNSLTRSCSSEFEVASAEVCDTCVADAHCKQGLICVHTTFGPEELEVGYFCLWIEGEPGAPESCALDGRPFVDTIDDVVSIDGQVATVCTLGTTTCPALRDTEFGQACDPYGDISEQCGHPGLEDGFCLRVTAYDFQCSIPCDSVDDCPADSASCATVNLELVCEQ